MFPVSGVVPTAPAPTMDRTDRLAVGDTDAMNGPSERTIEYAGVMTGMYRPTRTDDIPRFRDRAAGEPRARVWRRPERDRARRHPEFSSVASGACAWSRSPSRSQDSPEGSHSASPRLDGGWRLVSEYPIPEVLDHARRDGLHRDRA